jgi:hypothetical protein
MELLDDVESPCITDQSAESETSEIFHFNTNCSNCGSYNIESFDTTYQCQECGQFEIRQAPIEYISDSTVGNIRYSNSGGGGDLQKTVYSSAHVNSGELQKKTLIAEIVKCLTSHFQKTGEKYPLDVVPDCVDMYIKINDGAVHRSDCKRRLIAGCYFKACLLKNYMVSEDGLATALELKSKGISKGLTSVETKLDAAIDSLIPNINTMFIKLGLETYDSMDKTYESAKIKIYDLVVMTNRLHVGVDSIQRSKVAGATYLILKKYHPEAKTTLEQISKVSEIRVATIEKYTNSIIQRSSQLSY